MTGVSQFVSHPDAEQLAAFAEQALGPQEHAQILEHVATCNRCRQVVFLASDAAAEESIVTDAEASAAAPRFHWFSGWRLAYLPTAALALVALTVAFLHFHRGAPADLARLQTPPASDAPVPAPKSPQTAQTTNQTTPQATVRHATTPPPAAMKIPPAQVPAQVADAFAPAAVSPAPAEIAAETSPAPGIAMLRSPANTGQTPPPPPVQLANKVAGSAYDTANTAPRGQVLKAASQRARAFSLESAAQSSTPADRAFSVMLPSTGRTLPGGEAPVSLAQSAARTLALDRKGALYLSLDHGATWKPVVAQWIGRAVAVRFHAAAAAHSQQAAQPDHAAPARDFFEISNDAGQSWYSSDGVLWSAR